MQIYGGTCRFRFRTGIFSGSPLAVSEIVLIVKDPRLRILPEATNPKNLDSRTPTNNPKLNFRNLTVNPSS